MKTISNMSATMNKQLSPRNSFTILPYGEMRATYVMIKNKKEFTKAMHRYMGHICYIRYPYRKCIMFYHPRNALPQIYIDVEMGLKYLKQDKAINITKKVLPFYLIERGND